ncbi:MAG: hypothetical protein ACO3JL_18350 [Myxococcota bacterium]
MSPRARMIRLPTRIPALEAPPEPLVRLWVLRVQVRMLSYFPPQPDELEEQLRTFIDLGVLPKAVAQVPAADCETLLVRLHDELRRLEEQVRSRCSPWRSDCRRATFWSARTGSCTTASPAARLS